MSEEELIAKLLDEHRRFYVYPPGWFDCICGWKQTRMMPHVWDEMVHTRHVAQVIVHEIARGQRRAKADR